MQVTNLIQPLSHLRSSAFICSLILFARPVQAQTERPLVPPAFNIDEAASAAVAAEWLTDDEKREMRVFHGIWDDRDLLTPAIRAQVALNSWDFDHPDLRDQAAPVDVRAQAMLLAGEFEQAIALVQDQSSNRAHRIRAEALEGLGRLEEADRAIDGTVERLLSTRLNDAGELTEGVRAMIIRTRLQGQPARDYQTMINLLSRAHQELDRLYWPAKLAEAELLIEKSRTREAVDALHETLELNPRCAPAWYLLGRVALDRFDFASAQTAADALRRLNRSHPLANLLLAESRLIQDDPDTALEILDPLLARLPNLRPALAFAAAAKALLYDEQAMRDALARYDQLSPGSPYAYHVVGRHLSMNRQYETAAQMLEEAIRRAPAWPAPQIELGLMELQSGRDDRALAALGSVAKLDQFNYRAANSLFLLEDLATYRQIESEHFIVRHKPGVDQAMADMMLPQLEKIHEIVSKRFEHVPGRKTVIELMPNHERFAVRITGMPFVHTIAACTGPVIAMEVPKEGPPNRHLGLFDWPRVIQHEYTHTITLSQTRNRLPHWLTEAAAVSMELQPRSYQTCQMLAREFKAGTLLDLEDMKWAFVRPKRRHDRALAYAQGDWMVEYMNQRFGESALVRLLERYFHGEREQAAIRNALGLTREQFFADFKLWAGEQVNQWGLDAKPTLTELADEMRMADPEKAAAMAASRQARMNRIARALTEQIGAASTGAAPGGARGGGGLTADRWPPLLRPEVEITDEILAQWIARHPDHPDLAERQLRTHLEHVGDNASVHDEALMNMLQRYAALRPIDPYPHKKLAQLWLASDAEEAPRKAIEHLEFLDAREEKSPVYALELARLYRLIDEPEKALAKAVRAMHIQPFSAPNRELGAAIAIEADQYELARQHIFALTLLEPDRPQHAKRLAAIDRLIAQRQQ